MEFNVKEESKVKMIFELVGETHTFCNALKKELQQIKGVVIATYKIDHPLIGIPTFQIETKGIEPRKAIKDALKSLKKQGEEFQKEVSKL
jgi:DNA-directed RNA polymerase subunit L